jgi:drug/metabolite transporter (DMT)-like permease
MEQNLGIGLVVGALVIGRFLMRELRERRFLISRIYLVPAVLGVVGIVFVVLAGIAHPDTTPVIAVACVAALVLGAVIGYGVARNTTVRVTDDPTVLYVRGSAATVAIWLAALALRLVARIPFLSDPSRYTHWGEALNAALLILLASALFFVRYRLLAAGRLERERGIALASPAI